MDELLVTNEGTEALVAPLEEAPMTTPEEGVEVQAPATETEEENATDEVATEEEAPAVDYARMAEEDLREIQRIAPAFAHLTHLSQLPNATRYGALRDAGLSCEEAFWAVCHHTAMAGYDNRSHLVSAVPRGAQGNASVMTSAELAAAKELFGDLSESEIHRLYQKCRA